MWFLPLLLLTQFRLCHFSITFPNASDANELVRIHSFYQPSPFVDSVASLGVHAVTDLLTDQANVVISPLNIYSCLNILSLGAAGDTKEEIDKIVGHLEDENALSKILNALQGTNQASAVFFSRDVVPKTEFVQESSAKYQTEILHTDFMNGSQATSAINSWVASKTKGTIQEILHQDADPATKVLVVNALTFNGKWLHPFSPLATEMGRFDVDGGFINIPIMHLETYLPVIRRANYDAVGLPYEDGNLIMYVILPRNNGVSELRKVLYSFSSSDIKSFGTSSVTQLAFVEIPKFIIRGMVSLRDPLMKQGMTTAFDPEQSNFTNFSENKVDGIFVSDIYHSVYFEVNEHETVASAASAAILTKMKPFQFKVTRPFIFVISDSNGLLLFMGAVIKPE